MLSTAPVSMWAATHACVPLAVCEWDWRGAHVSHTLVVLAPQGQMSGFLPGERGFDQYLGIPVSAVSLVVAIQNCKSSHPGHVGCMAVTAGPNQVPEVRPVHVCFSGIGRSPRCVLCRWLQYSVDFGVGRLSPCNSSSSGSPTESRGPKPGTGDKRLVFAVISLGLLLP
jgi:hypothetical protein